MNNRMKIIAVEIISEHIIKNEYGTPIVDHDHYYIRVQVTPSYNWKTLSFVFPKTVGGLKKALNRAQYIADINKLNYNDIYVNGFGGVIK